MELDFAETSGLRANTGCWGMVRAGKEAQGEGRAASLEIVRVWLDGRRTRTLSVAQFTKECGPRADRYSGGREKL